MGDTHRAFRVAHHSGFGDLELDLAWGNPGRACDRQRTLSKVVLLDLLSSNVDGDTAVEGVAQVPPLPQLMAYGVQHPFADPRHHAATFGDGDELRRAHPAPVRIEPA
ncbi:hypothetical protein SDC9_192523 [bioreactor metagenome]|uniref:Uncharacterized protein n=1 Tax=bioreactor metagenome TaxID=1076179 RepID=A0A645I282_9ZZZZ